MSLFREQLEGRAAVKLQVEGRAPHSDITLAHRIEDRDEEDHYTRLLWLPSGDVVMTVSWNGFITAWNADTGARVFRARPGGDIRLSDAVLLAGRNQALVVGDLGSVFLVDTTDGSLIRRWEAPGKDWLTSVTAAADNSFFATGGQQGDVALWSLTEAAPLAQWRAHVWPVRSLALLNDATGRFVYSADPSGVKLWNIDTQTMVRALGDPRAAGGIDSERWWFSSLNYSADRTYVVAGGYDGAGVIDLANGELLRSYGGLTMGVLSTALNEASNEVAVVVRDFTMRVYDAETTEQKSMFWVPFTLFSVMVDGALNERGDRLAVATNDPSFSRMGSFPVLRIYRRATD